MPGRTGRRGTTPRAAAGRRLRQLGPGDVRTPASSAHFMAPYNEKVWATRSIGMSAAWIAERVSLLDWRRCAWSNALAGPTTWRGGPTTVSPSPQPAGRARSSGVPPHRFGDRIRYGAGRRRGRSRRAHRPHSPTARRSATSTWCRPCRSISSSRPCVGGARTVRARGPHARAQHRHVVGVGYEAPLTDERSWLYFPDPAVPFYRATNFAKYAPANVPGGDTARYSSWMCEVSSLAGAAARGRQVGRPGRGRLAPDRRGARPSPGRIAARRRDAVRLSGADPRAATPRSAVIQPWLDARGIYSRGRFGTWRYEVGNMDHAVKMGVDVARRIVARRRRGAGPVTAPTELTIVVPVHDEARRHRGGAARRGRCGPRPRGRPRAR